MKWRVKMRDIAEYNFEVEAPNFEAACREAHDRVDEDGVDPSESLRADMSRLLMSVKVIP